MSATTLPSPAEATEPAVRRPAGASLPRRWVRNPSALIGGIIVAVILAAALVSLVWTPYDPLGIAPSLALKGPSGGHVLGTDEYGRDVLSRLMAGSRITTYASVAAVLIGLVVGVPAGLVAAVRGGVISEIIMRTADILFAFPALLAAIAMTAALGASTTVAMVSIGIAFIPQFARVTRSAALGVIGSEFVLAARTYGRRRLAIVRRHVLPNIAAVILVQATLMLSLAILTESALDYLGLGTAPPTASWGQMLSTGQNYISVDLGLEIWPALTVFVAVLGFNLLSDGLREVLDPRLRR